MLIHLNLKVFLESISFSFMIVIDVEILQESFLSIQPKESQFDDIDTVIVEAPNSGTSILDKLGFLLQEEEFPNENYTLRDILLLKQQQYKTLKHAFQCNFKILKE